MQKLAANYGLDERSLALFRILLGFVLLIDLIRRYSHSSAMYTDDGIFSRTYFLETLNPYRWSLLFASGSENFVHAFLIVGMALSVALILGVRTRWVTMLLWVVLLSVQYRNTHLQNGADTLIRVSMFWAMFLPLGRCWSLDALYGQTPVQQHSWVNPRMVLSVATFALLFQNATMYGITAFLKSGARWNEEGSALYYALGARQITTPFGEAVFDNVPYFMLQAMTFGTLIIEFALPVLILLPYKSHLLRTVAVGAIIVLHLGILTTMTVGFFPVISIAIGLAALPTWFWDSVFAPFANKLQQTAIYARIPTLPRLLPVFPTGSGLAPQNGRISSRLSEGSDSHVLSFVQRPNVKPQQLVQTICNSICAVAIVMMVMWNAQSISAYEAPQPVKNTMVSIGLYQSWSMFAPSPPTSSSWTLVVGELDSGERVDLLMPIVHDDMSMRPEVNWDQSGSVEMQDKYWRKFFQSAKRDDDNLRQFAAYTCRTWNTENSGDERLSKIWLVQGYSKTLDDSEREKPVFDQLGSWKCK